MDAADLGTFAGALVAALGGREAIGWWLRARKDKESGGADTSRISKREAKDMADAAAAQAAKDTATVAALDALRGSIESHDKRDEERHQAMLLEIRGLRDKAHQHASTLMAHGHDIENLRERVSETRRLSGIDSGVHDVRGR